METCFVRNTVSLQEVFRGTKLPMSLPMHIKSPHIQRRFDEDLHRHMHVTLKQGASPTGKQNMWLIQKLQFTELQLLDTPLSPHSYILRISLSFSIKILSLQSQNKFDFCTKQKIKWYFDLAFSYRLGLAEQRRCNDCKNFLGVT
jgi:hypothetical protein